MHEMSTHYRATGLVGSTPICHHPDALRTTNAVSLVTCKRCLRRLSAYTPIDGS